MKANKLKKGDYLGVFAPSDFIKEKNTAELKVSEQLLEAYDLKVIYGKNLYSNSLRYSATVDEKISDFNQLLHNDKIKAIIFAKGGSNCNSILDKIEYEFVKSNPKIFIGFSDNTILLNAIYKKTGIVTYHFTNFKGFCEENKDFNQKQFENVFIEGNKGLVKQNSKWTQIKKGVASGKLVGGNISALVKLLNTEYCPNFKGKILFIEDLGIESSAEMISGYLYQLKQNNVFENIKGLLIGNYDSREGISLEEIVIEILKDYQFPIVKCDDFGHTKNNIVLPIGIKCILDADNCQLFYNEKPINK